MDGATFAKENGGDFVDVMVELQKDCGVYDLKMSGLGIQKSELEIPAKKPAKPWAGCLVQIRKM